MHVSRTIEARSRIIFAVEMKFVLLTGLCVRACMHKRVCVHVGIRARGRVSLLIQHATRMRHIVTSFVAPLPPPNISTLSHKGCDFWKKCY